MNFLQKSVNYRFITYSDSITVIRPPEEDIQLWRNILAIASNRSSGWSRQADCLLGSFCAADKNV